MRYNKLMLESGGSGHSIHLILLIRDRTVFSIGIGGKTTRGRCFSLYIGETQYNLWFTKGKPELIKLKINKRNKYIAEVRDESDYRKIYYRALEQYWKDNKALNQE